MGTTWTGEVYGIAGGLEKFDITHAPDEMTEAVGLGERVYLKLTKVSMSADEEICAIGIAPNAGSLGGSGDITSVELKQTEIHTEPKYLPVSAGSSVETGKSLFYVGTECLVFTAIEYGLTINGNGVCPVAASAINDFLKNYASNAFTPAHGNYEIAVIDALQINDRKVSQSQGIHTWTLGSKATVETASPGGANLLTLSSEVAAVATLADHCKFITITESMSKGKDSKAKRSTSIDFLPTA